MELSLTLARLILNCRPIWCVGPCLPTLHPGWDFLRAFHWFFRGTQTVKTDFLVSNCCQLWVGGWADISPKPVTCYLCSGTIRVVVAPLLTSATIFSHLWRSSAALWLLLKSRPVHSPMLSSHLFFCLPLFLFPGTVPCTTFLQRPLDLITCPNHRNFLFSQLLIYLRKDRLLLVFSCTLFHLWCGLCTKW